MAARLEGKVAVITGAGSGIGAASAELFCREGARVIAVDISGKQEDVAKRIGANCLPFHADVSKGKDVQAMLAKALFLASDESSFITGSTILIDGGYTSL